MKHTVNTNTLRLLLAVLHTVFSRVDEDGDVAPLENVGDALRRQVFQHLGEGGEEDRPDDPALLYGDPSQAPQRGAAGQPQHRRKAGRPEGDIEKPRRERRQHGPDDHKPH